MKSKHIEIMSSALSRGDFNAVVNQFEAVRKPSGEHFRLLGDALVGLGQYEQGVAALDIAAHNGDCASNIDSAKVRRIQCDFGDSAVRLLRARQPGCVTSRRDLARLTTQEGYLELFIGSLDRSLGCFSDALLLLSEVAQNDPARTDTDFALGLGLLWAGRIRESETHLHACLTDSRVTMTVRAWSLLALAAAYRGNEPDADYRLTRARNILLDQYTTPAAICVEFITGMVCRMNGEHVSATAAFGRAFSAALTSRDTTFTVLAGTYYGLGMLRTGRLDEALELSGRVWRIVSSLELPFGSLLDGYVRWLRGATSMSLGHWREAVTDLAEAQSVFRSHGRPVEEAGVTLHIFYLAGRLDDSRARQAAAFSLMQQARSVELLPLTARELRALPDLIRSLTADGTGLPEPFGAMLEYLADFPSRAPTVISINEITGTISVNGRVLSLSVDAGYLFRFLLKSGGSVTVGDLDLLMSRGALTGALAEMSVLRLPIRATETALYFVRQGTVVFVVNDLGEESRILLV
ncbi:hypothetical protein IHN63_00115 [Deinococcus sp. 6YEL10]|uniref:hypothetical protein n=1 Tax=Deinococcus sp. 6YEL10 TaxID=2745870 RepID=UPI001E3E0444|nr:hypothetical protein [Deinococcus sp. 6YEL10]MCD0159702.1 hypothetical protein [Deinococcus sp. 6YEL10]